MHAYTPVFLLVCLSACVKRIHKGKPLFVCVTWSSSICKLIPSTCLNANADLMDIVCL